MRVKFLRYCNSLTVPKMANFHARGRSPLCTYSKVIQYNRFLKKLGLRLGYFLFIRISNFLWLNTITKFLILLKKSQNYKEKEEQKKYKNMVLLLLFQKELFRCMHYFPKMQSNCSCKTFWSTFLLHTSVSAAIH